MMSIQAEPALGRPPGDILELGFALVAATPRLRRTARAAVADPARACRIVQSVLRETWSARERIAREEDVEDWLSAALSRRLDDAND